MRRRSAEMNEVKKKTFSFSPLNKQDTKMNQITNALNVKGNRQKKKLDD